MGEGGERARETGREGDVSDWLCLLDSHRFSFVLHRESRQRAISSLSHLDHGQVASPVPLSRTLPPVSETLPFPASKVRIKVKRLSFKASLVRSLLIPSDSIWRPLWCPLGIHLRRKIKEVVLKPMKSLNVGHPSLWQLISPHSSADGRGFRELASLLTSAVWLDNRTYFWRHQWSTMLKWNGSPSGRRPVSL